jgi:hypothetical protein
MKACGVPQGTGCIAAFLWTLSTGAKDQMRIGAIRTLPALAILLFALPALAAGTNSATYSASEPFTIGQTQLKPGTYSFQAVDGQNELEILQKGKVIGKAACHWVKLAARAQTSEVDTDSGRVTQVSFRGNEQAVQID